MRNRAIAFIAHKMQKQALSLQDVRSYAEANPRLASTVAGGVGGAAIGGALSRKNRLMGVLAGAGLGSALGYGASELYDRYKYPQIPDTSSIQPPAADGADLPPNEDKKVDARVQREADAVDRAMHSAKRRMSDEGVPNIHVTPQMRAMYDALQEKRNKQSPTGNMYTRNQSTARPPFGGTRRPGGSSTVMDGYDRPPFEDNGTPTMSSLVPFFSKLQNKKPVSTHVTPKTMAEYFPERDFQDDPGAAPVPYTEKELAQLFTTGPGSLVTKAPSATDNLAAMSPEDRFQYVMEHSVTDAPAKSTKPQAAPEAKSGAPSLLQRLMNRLETYDTNEAIRESGAGTAPSPEERQALRMASSGMSPAALQSIRDQIVSRGGETYNTNKAISNAPASSYKADRPEWDVGRANEAFRPFTENTPQESEYSGESVLGLETVPQDGSRSGIHKLTAEQLKTLVRFAATRAARKNKR